MRFLGLCPPLTLPSSIALISLFDCLSYSYHSKRWCCCERFPVSPSVCQNHSTQRRESSTACWHGFTMPNTQLGVRRDYRVAKYCRADFAVSTPLFWLDLHIELGKPNLNSFTGALRLMNCRPQPHENRSQLEEIDAISGVSTKSLFWVNAFCCTGCGWARMEVRQWKSWRGGQRFGCAGAARS